MVLKKLVQCSFLKLSSPRAAFPVTAAKQASSGVYRLIHGVATALPANAKAAADLKKDGMIEKIKMWLTSDCGQVTVLVVKERTIEKSI